MVRGQIPHNQQSCSPELKPQCSLSMSVTVLHTFYRAQQPTVAQYLGLLFMQGLVCVSVVLWCFLPPEPDRRETRDCLGWGGQWSSRWPGWKALHLGSSGSCKSHHSTNPGHKAELLFSVSQPSFALCSRRELLPPSMGQELLRKGICTNKLQELSILINLFRTSIADEFRCLLEATRFCLS